MNAKTFKNLIKEAVREAVREEIGVLLLEQKKQELTESKNTLSFTTKEVHNVGMRAKLKNQLDEAFNLNSSPMTTSVSNTNNPFAAFIEDAGANMTAQDLSGLRNLG